MAERRMLSTKITESDAFLDLPLSAQALYMHISMRADDDGFVNNVKTIARMIGADEEDIDILVRSRFLLVLADGLYCVKHWRINNQIRKDRYHATPYRDVAEKLYIKANGAYTEDEGKAIMQWSPIV